MNEYGTPFDDIYEMFLGDVTSRELQKLLEKDEELMKEVLKGLLYKARIRFKMCLQDLHDVNEYGFNITLTEEEKYILATGMRYHWIIPQVNQEDIMRKQVQDRDFKEHPTFRLLETLQAVKKETELELKRLERDYSWNGFR